MFSSKTLQNIATGTLIFALMPVFTFTAAVNTQEAAGNSGIAVGPNSENYDPKEIYTKSSFIKVLKPGDSFQSSISISNFDPEEKRLLVDPEDYSSANGSFSFTDQEDLSGVGNWIKLDSNEVTVPGKKMVNVGFKLTVPTDVKSGEYAGVVAVKEAPKGPQGSGLNVVSRVGVRFYITIPGDLKKGFEFTNFKFITPDKKYTSEELYSNFIKDNAHLNNEEVYLNMNFKNIGNVFTKMVGKVEMTGPDGKTIETKFNRDYGYTDSLVKVDYLSIPGSKWQVGKYKARFTFDDPLVVSSYKSEVKEISPTKMVETEFEMNQANLDQIKSDFEKYKSGKTQPKIENKGTKQTQTIKEETPKEEKHEAKTEPADSKSEKFLTYTLGFVVLLLLGIVAYLLLTKKRTAEKSSDKALPKETLINEVKAEKIEEVTTKTELPQEEQSDIASSIVEEKTKRRPKSNKK